MAITAALLTSGANSTDANSFATASVSPGASRLVDVSVLVTQSGAVPGTPTLSGNGLTYVQVATTPYDTVVTSRARLTRFRALGATPSAGVITIDLGGVTHTGCAWVVMEYDGIDTGGTHGSAAVVQSAVAAADAVAQIAPVLGSFSNVSNWTSIAAAVDNNTALILSPEAGYTERAEVNFAGPSTALAVADKDANDATPTYDSAEVRSMGGIAIEIAAAPVAGAGSPYFLHRRRRS